MLSTIICSISAISWREKFYVN